MIYRGYNEAFKKLGTYEPLWLLEWSVSSFSYTIGKTKAMEGMFIPINMETSELIPIDEETSEFSSSKKLLFVPFIDDAQTYDEESLDFTMAQDLPMRYGINRWIFADSKYECYQQYAIYLKEFEKKLSSVLASYKFPNEKYQNKQKIEEYEKKLETIKLTIKLTIEAIQTPEGTF